MEKERKIRNFTQAAFTSPSVSSVIMEIVV